nr:glucoamylase family protein [Candidatus Sigynarchaeota archaeon]
MESAIKYRHRILESVSEINPFRSELFSLEQLEHLGYELAGWHEIKKKNVSLDLLDVLEKNRQTLESVRTLLQNAVDNKYSISPAGEWILDNYYLIAEQISTIKYDFPIEYLMKLPQLANGDFKGIPRIYDIIVDLLAHTDSKIDKINLQSIIYGYQRKVALTLAELWAIPVLFRIGLIENIKRIAVAVASSRREYDKAAWWIARLDEVSGKDPSQIIVVVAELVKAKPDLTPAFVTEFTRQLRSKDMGMVISWLNQYLAVHGKDVDSLSQVDNQRQSMNRISIANCMQSLRFVSSAKWNELIESFSKVEEILRSDADDVYTSMDFSTRDMYRHAIEEISSKYSVDEVTVSEEAVKLARVCRQSSEKEDRHAHVGYYLIDEGYPELLRALHKKMDRREAAVRNVKKHRLFLYIASIVIFTLGFASLWYIIENHFALDVWKLAFYGVMAVFCLSHVGILLVNQICIVIARPKVIPKMDFDKGIPDNARTLVAIPMLLLNKEEIDEQLRKIEAIYISNNDPNFYFALLTDLPDAMEENIPGDEALINHTEEGITLLNEKYVLERKDIFFFLHRKRVWNQKERIWMGWDRKRGIIMELNRAIQDPQALNRFHTIVGNPDTFRWIKYVITLDMDTFLPFGSAKKLVGSMEHPLNKPIFDERRKRVVKGYGVMQPTILMDYASSRKSRYARLLTSDTGIDPYTQQISNVYQDTFDEASFTGKGIYNLDTFMEALDDNIPSNLILSHDLLEGCHARAALVSDVRAYEDGPSNYLNDILRQHRWIRGDWQISRWLKWKVKDAKGNSIRNPISGLSRWKILDNLRRSLFPMALLCMLIAAWYLFDDPLLWTGIFLFICFFSPILMSFQALLSRPKRVAMGAHLRAIRTPIKKAWGISFLKLTVLPFEACFFIDAILRAIVRLTITRRNLLEWITFQQTRSQNRTKLSSFFRVMWMGPLVSAILLIATIYTRLQLLPILSIISFLWLISPIVMWRLSKPISQTKAQFSASQRTTLGKLARKTWSYFDTFVGPGTHWLPPDNFQENNGKIIANRTSPTNMGLALLSSLAAWDLGYIGLETMLSRLLNSIAVMLKLERYRGHFYNWYDIERLEPLKPLYVSTVDSGNLVGYLLTLRQGLLEIPEHAFDIARFTRGATDAINLTFELLEKSNVHQEKRISAAVGRNLQLLKEIKKKIAEFPVDAEDKYFKLQEIAGDVGKLDSFGVIGEEAEEITRWIDALKNQLTDAVGDINRLFSWIRPLSSVRSFLRAIESGEQPGKATFPATAGASLQDLFDTCTAALKRPSLFSIMKKKDKILSIVKNIIVDEDLQVLFHENASLKQSLLDFQELYERAIVHALQHVEIIDQLTLACKELSDIEYAFLISKDTNLFSIGFNVDLHRLDDGSYDLFASEARLASFIAVAYGHLDMAHWFALNRGLVSVHGNRALISWGGTMFEYLMPLLVMPNYEETLLDMTYKSVVAAQIDYGSRHGVPWGISESGYNITDAHGNYQYQAFGVPELGLKRGLEKDLVVSPYASIMALMVSPQRAMRNIARMNKEGFEGNYGFYEAIDYTEARKPPGASFELVRSFMTHHQGIILLSITNVILDRVIQKRFESEPHFNSVLLLLQEKIPTYVRNLEMMYVRSNEERKAYKEKPSIRVFDTPNTPYPEVQLLSNGRYHVMINNAGSGYSRWKDLFLTRWREDICQDMLGFFTFLSNSKARSTTSVGYQPVVHKSSNYKVVFSSGRAEIFNSDEVLSTHTTVVVSPEADLEMRHIEITNTTNDQTQVQILTYLEVVLSSLHEDEGHPSFNKLFIETETYPELWTVIARRRKRSPDKKHPIIFHSFFSTSDFHSEATYETSRERFIGRYQQLKGPSAARGTVRLSNTTGNVLDPIMSICHSFVLEPEQKAGFYAILGVADSVDHALTIIERYRNKHISDRVFDIAWAFEQQFIRQHDIDESDASMFEQLAGSIVYASSKRRADGSIILKNKKGQDGLWAINISGDLPIVLVTIKDPSRINLIRQAVKAHEYWRAKGIDVDMVIVNQDYSGYRQVLHDQILGIIAAEAKGEVVNKGGGYYIFKGDQLSEEHKILLQAAARIVLRDEEGTLEDQTSRQRVMERMPRKPARLLKKAKETPRKVEMPYRELIFFNGTGGFTPDGKEYVIFVMPGTGTPRPWINVLANEQFGSIVSESGASYTWFENAHEFRLTPWYNDWISDLSGESFYLRDDETFAYWSLAPLPARGKSPYTCRHGLGYSAFEYTEDQIESEMWQYVPLHQPVKIVRIKVRNRGSKARAISIFSYVEWVMGDHRSRTNMHVTTTRDIIARGIFANNPFHVDSSEKVAFLVVNEGEFAVTGDRAEFIGRNRTLKNPAALERDRLSNRAGAAFDPCGAIQVPVLLSPGEQKEVVFTIGCARTAEAAHQLAAVTCGIEPARRFLEEIWHYWPWLCGSIYLETPDPSINVLGNWWLLYQAITCRFKARSGFYQSSGAFGFRDQLQDAMAFIHADPGITRAHILTCASHQFVEGDVQHWWHPPSGRGVRTAFSDDLLWLPFVVCFYVLRTKDVGILGTPLPFIEGRLLADGEESYYDLPSRSTLVAPLYEHCKLAIERGFQLGVHGLPLMGCGDWNDGMNLVGKDRGESVWLAFFLNATLKEFSKIAVLYGDGAYSDACMDRANKLETRIDATAWDGGWYKRAFFGDGTPLGSITNSECKIDSLPQSWAVLSGSGKPQRVQQAMDSVYRLLVDKGERIVKLFDPPFNVSALEPGYIKGYPPGIRENGGQYTHAAIWVAMAFAKLKDRERTGELLSYINPIHHGDTPERVQRYKVEPYVMCADVYTHPDHEGQGGWTWYTGSGGWMYRLIIESILGIQLEGDRLRFSPCIPPGWTTFKIHYRYHETTYHITYSIELDANTIESVIVDGMENPGNEFPLINDHGEHEVKLVFSPNDRITKQNKEEKQR